jgi:hypothetical protein
LRSGSDVVLVGEPAENLSAVDPVLGEIDRLWWLSLGLSWCELAERAVRPGSVIVPQVFGQRPSQVAMRITSLRTAAAVDGRPGRRRLE